MSQNNAAFFLGVSMVERSGRMMMTEMSMISTLSYHNCI